MNTEKELVCYWTKNRKFSDWNSILEIIIIIRLETEFMLVLFYLVLYLFYYIIILYNVSSIQCYIVIEQIEKKKKK